jgi:hypothetical protein
MRPFVCRTVFLLLLLSCVCGADEVKFATSNTFGCFSASTCPATSSQAAVTDLSFSGSSFGQPNGIATTNGALNINLGSFTLTDNNSTFINTNFDSKITFTLPVEISGGQSSSLFDARVIGIVGRNLAGAVYIDFDTSPQHFTFSNGTYNGSFDFNVNDILFGVVGYGGTSTVSWNGHVANAVETLDTRSVPEPSSLVLLGTSFAALLGSRRLIGKARS